MQPTMKRKIHISLPTLALVGILAGCARDAAPGNGESTTTAETSKSANGRTAVATINPTQGNQARGTVRFVEESGGVRVIADITGLSPGDHGFHIHENADCSAPDASSAGGHFNPTQHKHASRDANERHMGDLGNLTADQSGRAQLNYLDTKLKLSGEHSIIGRSVVVHAAPDDFTSQPSGNSGARIGCGAIEAGGQ